MFLLTLLIGCSQVSYDKQVAFVERDRFMGTWYVHAGRFTSLEDDAFTPIEKYTWNEKEQRIDIDYSYRDGSVTGELKKIPQKAWIEKHPSNARWQVRPIWPLLFDYRVVALDPDYQWTAIGVPSEKYLWIMARSTKFSREQVTHVLEQLKAEGYDTADIKYLSWP
jgi:apolipoprotein D and lipocalin family protein